MTSSVRFGSLFDGPFLEGSSSSPEVPFRFQVAINGRGYIIEPRKYKRTTIPAIRQPIDQSTEPGEQTLNSEGLWRRSQENWVLGAGQEYLDNRASQFNLFTRAGENQSIRYRFWKSKGVDPWTEGHLTLLPETEKKRASANTNLALLVVGTRLYICDGSEVYFTADPTVANPTFTAANIAAGGASSSVVSMATDGSTVWALLADNRIQQTTGGATTSTNLATLSGTTPGVIGYANGRLIASIDNKLYEVARAGTLTQIGNPANNNPSFTWTSIVGAPNAIYAAGYAASHGEIYSITVDATTGGLNSPVFATALPEGEVPNAIKYYGGFVIIGSSVGIRVSDISRSDNGLVYGPAIAAANAKCLATWGEFCWYGLTNLTGPAYNDPTASVTSTGLGRVDLGRFTASNIPAYATDLMATDGITGTVLSCASFNDKRYFAVSGSGFWGPNANKVATGWVQSGLIRFGTTEPKVLAGADSRFNPLPAGATVGMLVVKESGDFTIFGESTTESTLGSDRLDTSVPLGESFQVQMYLARGTDTTTAPDLRRWTAKALVVPQRMDEIILPIMMRQTVDTISGDGESVHYSPMDEFLYLKALENDGTIIRYQEGSKTYRAYIDRVELEMEKFTDDRTFFQGYINVRLLTIPG